MHVFLWTDGDRERSAAARQWFFQMHELLRSANVDADLNVLGEARYDVAVVHWARPDIIHRVLDHSPDAHVGVLNPGYLGFPSAFIDKADSVVLQHALQQVVANVDFFVVTGFIWRDMLLSAGRRVYETIDYVSDLTGRPVKQHAHTQNLVIGYHGNELHYAHDFFPHGAAALRRLASKYDFTVKIVTRNAKDQPKIDGVRSVAVEWELETFEMHLQSFDVGICPAFSSYGQLRNPFTYVRNPNRVNTLLSYGIPAVTSPVFQSCHDLKHGETVLFAVTEAGWYDALQQLITKPDLRNRIGYAGRAMVEQRFSEKVAVARFISMLEEEVRMPIFSKAGFDRTSLIEDTTLSRIYNRAKQRLYALLPQA